MLVGPARRVHQRNDGPQPGAQADPALVVLLALATEDLAEVRLQMPVDERPAEARSVLLELLPARFVRLDGQQRVRDGQPAHPFLDLGRGVECVVAILAPAKRGDPFLGLLIRRGSVLQWKPVDGQGGGDRPAPPGDPFEHGDPASRCAGERDHVRDRLHGRLALLCGGSLRVQQHGGAVERADEIETARDAADPVHRQIEHFFGQLRVARHLRDAVGRVPVIRNTPRGELEHHLADLGRPAHLPEESAVGREQLRPLLRVRDRHDGQGRVEAALHERHPRHESARRVFELPRLGRLGEHVVL